MRGHLHPAACDLTCCPAEACKSSSFLLQDADASQASNSALANHTPASSQDEVTSFAAPEAPVPAFATVKSSKPEDIAAVKLRLKAKSMGQELRAGTVLYCIMKMPGKNQAYVMYGASVMNLEVVMP